MKPYYEHAGVTLYHGDCREILPNLPRVDLVLTDPPYGINWAGEPTKWQRRAGKKAEDWDRQPASNILQVIQHGESAVVWGGNYYDLPVSRGWLAWFKPDAPPSMGSFELAWTNRDHIAQSITHSISATNPERVGHPAQKPLAVMLWCLRFFPQAQSVLDPFSGSGTTLAAAKWMGIPSIGIEIDERYCEIAAKRLGQEVLCFSDPISMPKNCQIETSESEQPHV